jgi:hypothetical protein
VNLYRVFWWDGRSVGDNYGGPLYVPKPLQRSGHRGSRHNLPDLDGVLYCSMQAVSAVAEALKPFSGQSISESNFQNSKEPFHRAIAGIEYSGPGLPDSGDPAVLASRGWQISAVTSLERETSQGIARLLFAEGHCGFIWPSVLNPEWRNVTLFESRILGMMSVKGTSARLAPDNPAVQAACRYLGIAAKLPG